MDMFILFAVQCLLKLLICFMCMHVTVGKVCTKWHGIRASFAREIRMEKESRKRVSGKRKRAVYKYARNLAFLRPHMRLKNQMDNYNNSNIEEVTINNI